MSVTDTTIAPEVLPVFYKHNPIVFDPGMLKSLKEVFRKGTTLEYLSYIRNLSIDGSVMNYFGTSLSLSLNVATPGLQCVELLSLVNDVDVQDSYGELAVFTPEQFWNNVVKVIEHERNLSDQSDSLLGEDTTGLVFLVEKLIKDVPRRFAVNLYHEHWKQKTEYYLKLFPTGGMWEVGHSFVLKVPR
ncbi:MAG: hypothetical protein WAV09_01845 [Minisyncoccia bacterium]